MADIWCGRPDHNQAALTICREFIQSTTCCGQAANCSMLANALNGQPNGRQLAGICHRDTNAGLSGPGNDAQTIKEVYQDLTQFEGHWSQTIALYPNKEWYTTDDLAAVSRSLIGKTGGIIALLQQAYKLPFMEAGVHGHFIYIGAYDSSHGGTDNTHFYVLNPDRVPAPDPTRYGGDWMSIFQVCNAGLYGMVRVYL